MRTINDPSSSRLLTLIEVNSYLPTSLCLLELFGFPTKEETILSSKTLAEGRALRRNVLWQIFAGVR